MLGATLLAVLCFAPSLVSGVLGASDHCARHDDGHAHFCFRHLATHGGGLLGTLVLAAAAVLASAGVVRLGTALLRGRKAVLALLDVPRVQELPGGG